MEKYTKECPINIKDLQDQGSVYEGIKFAQDIIDKNFPIKSFNKPILAHNHTADEAKRYAQYLAEWELDKARYNSEVAEWRNLKALVEDVIMDFIKLESGFYGIPNQYKDGVYRYAYELGHSAGYHEIFSHLCGLVTIFETKNNLTHE